MFSTVKDEFGFIPPMSFGEFSLRPVKAFHVSNVPKGTIQGSHAHKSCHQLLACLSGQILCELTKSDGSFGSIALNSPTDASHDHRKHRESKPMLSRTRFHNWSYLGGEI